MAGTEVSTERSPVLCWVGQGRVLTGYLASLFPIKGVGGADHPCDTE